MNSGRYAKVLGFLIFVISFSHACRAQTPYGIDPSEVFSAKAIGENSEQTNFRVETVAEGLEVPWGLAFLPDGGIFVTERPGRVRLIKGGKLQKDPVFVVSDVEPSGESGLMDITLHPAFASNHFVYLSYAYKTSGAFVKVVRYKYDGKRLVENRIVIDNIPAAQFHAGTRNRFGPDGKLYVTTGDSTDWNLAQATNSLAGKTLRLNDDGSIPKDNPFFGNQSFRPEIFSIGHRNAQGLAFEPGSGLMFQTEHGPSGFEGKGGGGDEVNIVERGKNYGWAEISHNETKQGMESPLLEYTPACAPGSAMFYNGDNLPNLRGNFLFGCLRGVRIIRVVLNGRKVVGQENLLEGKLGRIREMEQGPDGNIYFTTSNHDGRGHPNPTDDCVMRIVNAK